MRSYYLETASDHAAQAALSGPVDARVCVIGGGLAGLNTALGLLERGMRDIVVLEAGRVGHGASGRNGGFVFGGFSRGEDALLRELGPDRARDLYGGTLQAVELIRRRIHTHRIDCQPVEAGVIWANWFQDERVLRERQQLLADSFGVQWDWIARDELREQLRTDRYHGGLMEGRGFHFHPLRYVQGLADQIAGQGGHVHEYCPALSLKRVGSRWQVDTPDGCVVADEVVLACGGYLAGLRRVVDAAVMPIATYVMVTDPLGARLGSVMNTRAAVYDTRFAFDYYRPLPDTRLLWGGRISVLDRSPADVERLLRRDLLKVYQQLHDVGIEYAWSGLMSYARHQMPQIGRIEDGLWLAQAFGGHGVAPTTFAGELVAAAIAENDTRWREFSDYGLVSALKPAGFIGAQLTYWWHQARDAWKAGRERSG
ncbi:MAG: FAD-dependent oxidoreductase [Lysobacterales bacterium RIFOXYA1_FULL_69_10]|nr:MAG: FAD-dependent oxidoreductase [Xanthomonadales bacterium RIFOXYA1_FULL_69_10]